MASSNCATRDVRRSVSTLNYIYIIYSIYDIYYNIIYTRLYYVIREHTQLRVEKIYKFCQIVVTYIPNLDCSNTAS